jgi:hypothetical protein
MRVATVMNTIAATKLPAVVRAKVMWSLPSYPYRSAQRSSAEKVSGDLDQLSAVFAGPSHDAVREHQKSKRCGKISEKKKDEYYYLFLDPPSFK